MMCQEDIVRYTSRRLENKVLIGMGAMLMDAAEEQEGCITAAELKKGLRSGVHLCRNTRKKGEETI